MNRYTQILILTLLFSPFLGKSNAVDSLTKLLNIAIQNNDYSQQCHFYFEKGERAYQKHDFEYAIENLKKALSLSQQLEQKTKNCDISLLLAKSYQKQSAYHQAIEVCNQIIDIANIGQGKHLPAAYHELSKIHQTLGNNKRAYEYSLKALQIWEKQQDSIGVHRANYQLGMIFFYQGNYDLALQHYEIAKNSAFQLQHQKYAYNSLAAIGGTYSRLGHTEKAIEYNMAAYQMAKKMNYLLGLAYSTHNVGISHYQQQQYDTALVFLLESLELKRQLHDKWGQTASLGFIGNTYSQLQNLDKGFEYWKASLELAKGIKARPRILEAYDGLANLNEKRGDFEQANLYWKAYIDLKDTIVNETTSQQLSETKTKYEIQKKETELIQKDLQFAKTFRYTVMVIFALLLLLSWLLYSKNRQQLNANKVLIEKNQKIQEQNQKLAKANEMLSQAFEKINAQNQKLENSNQELQRFAFIASHDLKEPLRTIGSYANLVRRRYQNKLDEEANEFLVFITSGVSRMYHLLNDVLNFSRIEEKVDTVSTNHIQGILDIVQKNLAQQIYENNTVIEVLTPLPSVRADEHHLVQIFQNLISNAIKFSQTTATIKIACKDIENAHLISVQDNGIGIHKAYQTKIFEMFQRLNRQDEYEGTGIGLAVCKKIIQQYHGEIWVESIEGQGSTFYFTFPKIKNQESLSSSMVLINS